VIETTSKAKLS